VRTGARRARVCLRAAPTAERCFVTSAATATTSPPHGFALPVLGNLPEITRFGILEFLAREWRRHGDLFSVRLGPRRALVVVHPDLVEQVLSVRRQNYVKGPTYDTMRLLTGDGLLTLDGESWRVRRRLEQPAFHRDNIRRFVASMVSITRDAIAAWRWRAPNGGTMDMHHEMMRLTLEIVAETLFGQRLGEATGDESGRAFGEALRLISDRSNTPVAFPTSVPTPANLRLRRAIRALDETVHAIVARARASRDPAARPTLLGMLLDARDADTGARLSDADLRNEVITLFLAGHETTALLLTWAFTLLAQAPHVVARMRAEVDAVLGDRAPTAEDLPRLGYVRQVVDEVLRLRPSAWTVARDAVADDVLGGFAVHAGDVVLPLTYLTHRHPDFWPDPERFDPERFDPQRAKARHHWAYYPFSLGPRVCIGNTFALAEGQVILTMLVQALEFGMAAPRAVRPTAVVTLRPSGAVPVNIRWRS
jgi:cytochrome P450